jgi:large subunit ribosomal protein L11
MAITFQKVKLFIGAGEASSAQPTGPILGQIQINITDFIAKFNALSLATYEKGVPVATVVRRNPKDKSYAIVLKGPTTFSLIDTISGRGGVREYISITQAYDLLRIKERLVAERKLSPQAVARSLFGTLRSAKIGLQISDAVEEEFLD